MRILILNVNGYTGSTGKIAYGAYKFLQNTGHDVRLCYGGMKEKRLNDPDVIPLNSKFEYTLSGVITKLTGQEGHCNPRATSKLVKIISKFKPDLVQLYNLHGYYINQFALFNYLKKCHIPTLYTLFDEYAYTAHCGFSLECNKFKENCDKCPNLDYYPGFFFVDRCHSILKEKAEAYANFPELYFAGVKWIGLRSKESALLKDKVFFELDEPINYDDRFYPRDVNQLKQKLGIPEDKIIIVTVSDSFAERKGPIYFYELAKKFEANSDYIFVFVGYQRTDWELPQNFIPIGFVNNQNELAEYYSLADLFVCPSLADTTPNTCLDAMGCGSPILGFDISGIPYCADPPIGKFVEAKNVDALAEIVLQTKKKTPSSIAQVRNYAYKRFAASNVYKKQLEIYNKIVLTQVSQVI